MNYEKILRSSWKIIKNNKVLWILGMLLGGAGFIGSGSGWNFNSSDIRSFSEEVSIGDSERVPAALRLFASDVLSAMTKVSPWVWALILVLFVVVVAIGVVIRICIKNWAEGAIQGAHLTVVPGTVDPGGKIPSALERSHLSQVGRGFRGGQRGTRTNPGQPFKPRTVVVEIDIRFRVAGRITGVGGLVFVSQIGESVAEFMQDNLTGTRMDR